MGSTYKHLRCTGCDGTLKYDKSKKVWICIYCGNEIHREEQYDGLYTIKNVVKQVLADLAYGRLDSAQKNVVECEKIASSYVGTMIAQLCMNVFLLITPGACPNSQVKSLYGQIKRIKEQIDNLDSGISTEEEALYEAIDGNNDAMGVLILVYDTIKADVHLNFVENFFDASTVYSVELNAHLLNYALRNHKIEIVDKIFANSANINCRKSAFILLKSYDDGEQKRTYVKSIFSRADFQSDDYKEIEKYLTETSDGIDTKIEVYENSVLCGIAPSVRLIIDYLLIEPEISKEQIKKVMSAFCQSKPKDAELYELIEVIYTKHTGAMATQVLQILLENQLFIKPSVKVIRTMVEREDWSVEERILMLELTQKCKIDARNNDVILGDILLNLDESTDVRKELICKMSEYVDTISTASLTDYILKNNHDGERKPEILEIMLQLNLNMSFFRDVLSKYMKTTVDTLDVKNQIAQMLSEKGLLVNSEVLLDMACKASTNNYMETVSFIQTALNNGTRLDHDTLSRYLEIVQPELYQSELIAILHTSATRISDKALAKYVMDYSKEDYEIKKQNCENFAQGNGKRFGTSSCERDFFGKKLQCNLLQAYVLCSTDSLETKEAMIALMKNAGAKLNPAIMLDGQTLKFKKIVVDYKSKLSSETLTICEKNKVFSLFF